MKTFKDYEELIIREVNRVSEKDANWDWKVDSIEDSVVRIRWGYLEYLGEKNNCFSLYLRDEDEEFGDIFLVGKTPQDQTINGYLVSASEELRSWQTAPENSIRYIIDDIADYAHSRY